MTIHFGYDFDGPVLGKQESLAEGHFFAGPNKLLQWMEAQLGLGGYTNNTNYLRIELYRQALGMVNDPFYARSYEADRFATAAYLLDWRDELLLAGWRFEIVEGMPERLHTLALVEQFFQKKHSDPALEQSPLGYSDRFEQVLRRLEKFRLPLDELLVYEPEPLQKPHMKRLISLLQQQAGCQVSFVLPQRAGLPPNVQVLVLKCRRDSDAAILLAQICRDNPSFNPVILTPPANLALEQTFVNEGLPAMGILSASLARPSLQVLKLAPVFMWEPVDVFKVMEFLTLPLKPLDAGLSLEIARVMAEKPGFFSDTWFAALYGYLESAQSPEELRAQYDFWFERRRYPADKSAPKKEAELLYAYLNEWARNHYEATGSNNNSLLVLAEQARHIQNLLEALPEQRISFLEMERIVRTIFEASPIHLSPAERGSFKFVHKPGAIAAPVDTLVWWNFTAQNESVAPEKWHPVERAWLATQQVHPFSSRSQGKLQLMLQQRPFQYCNQKIVLVVPENIDGTEVQPSLLLSDLEVSLGGKFAESVFDLDKSEDVQRLSEHLRVPGKQSITVRQSNRPKPHLHIAQPSKVLQAEYETPTNLESLFYYPHRWFFRQKLRLFPSSLLSVTSDTTLLGSLAHRFFENLLQENLTDIDRPALQQWVNNQAASLLPKEGATLLLYGREPERNAFLNRVKNAAWNLLLLLRSNDWAVAQTEMQLDGAIGDMPIRGKADLVLQRGHEQAIVDLKWSGARRRKELIVNEEDLQLVLYAKMLPPPENWPHTAYFILDEGKIIARNAHAFKEAIVAGRGDEGHEAVNERSLQKMQNTYTWRLRQVTAGMIELRTNRTAPELEALYEGQLLDLLEMKNEDARWDDYRTLIGS